MGQDQTISSDPLFIHSALGRAGYGASPADVAWVRKNGFPGWVEAQLVPREPEDTACHERLARLQMRIKYAANDKWPAVDELRPLATLDQPIEALWPLMTRRAEMDGAERRRPRDEIVAATILRAVHSKWQLREVLCNFWHDHFNVDAFSNEAIAVALPVYDREVIRAHCLGNFRPFLEAVATSAAMQYYLSNRSSRAGAANENYARELFELHTLGRAAYLNDRYDRWRDVPGALKGAPTGYIDQDVYEAARAFTGWTIEDGTSIDGRRKLPETGRFSYVESWHDGYQKRVLAHEFDAFAAAMVDGRKVLDLVADHPATSRFLVTKLCRRFVGEPPPERLIGAASDAWRQYRKAPDQIARVVRLILLSPEFAAARNAKVRRPLALAAAFARGAGIDLVPTEGLANEIANAGQRLFGWPAPTGLPDERGFFLGTTALRRRWNIVLGIAENYWATGPWEPSRSLAGRPPTPRAAVNYFLAALNSAAGPVVADAIIAGAGWPADQPLGFSGKPDTEKRLARLAALCAMAPAFQEA
ncbi:MAG TPA: DUF1800 domain-containing protein [Stellaceae bacterium]|nr:DUF1800 domain-containing protein [Stellaceae bacterium]